MFNYQYDAPERHLWMDMGTELVPLLDRPPELIGSMAKYFIVLLVWIRALNSWLFQLCSDF